MKVFPWLPVQIYGAIAIICGFLYLYVPETTNLSLPNSVEEIIARDKISKNTFFKRCFKS